MATLILCFLFLSPNAQKIDPKSLTDKICVSGSFSFHLNGEYDHFSFDSSTHIPQYFNPSKKQYIYPQMEESITKTNYLISSNPSQSISDASSMCEKSNLNECFQNWKSKSVGNQFVDDTDMRLVNCNDICVSGGNHVWLEGKYEWIEFDKTINTSVYYCTECSSYLYGHIFKDTNRNYYNWRIGPNAKSAASWSSCYIQISSNEYKFDLDDCIVWDDAINGQWVDSDMKTHKCPQTANPTVDLTKSPSMSPSASINPTTNPSYSPTTSVPTRRPTNDPTFRPTTDPTSKPTQIPSIHPTMNTMTPSMLPSLTPTLIPTMFTPNPTMTPSVIPTLFPTLNPSFFPTFGPSLSPSFIPTMNPTVFPTFFPTLLLSANPTPKPTNNPTKNPTKDPTNKPTLKPAAQPSLNPTGNPTIVPSINPTLGPSVFPTFDPSSNPSIHPTGDPTQIPSVQPTLYPTKHPSVYPTKYPTSTIPTKSPSIDPSKDPSKFPTTAPSQSPVVIPTTKPTQHPIPSPTFMPTLLPTHFPTFNPSINPSYSPSVFPSIMPSKTPIFLPEPIIRSELPTTTPSIHPTELLSTRVTNTFNPSVQPTEAPIFIDTEFKEAVVLTPTNPNTIDSFYYVVGATYFFFLLITIISWLDSKLCCRKNDYFDSWMIFSSSLSVLTFVSSLFFIHDVWAFYSMFYPFRIIFILSICFVIIPLIISLIQLHYVSLSKYWIYNQQISDWWFRYSSLMYFYSIMTGSSFTAIQIFNSNIFGFDLFYMGIPRQFLYTFIKRKIYSIVLCGNIPMIILTVWFMILLGDFESITLTATAFNVISIVMALHNVIVYKQTYLTKPVHNDYQLIVLDVVGISSMDIAKGVYKKRMKAICEYLCQFVFGANQKYVQMMKPYILEDGEVCIGLQLQIHITAKQDGNGYEDLLNVAIDYGEFQKIIQKEWQFECVPKIENVSCQFAITAQSTEHLTVSNFTDIEDESDDDMDKEDKLVATSQILEAWNQITEQDRERTVTLSDKAEIELDQFEIVRQ